MIKVIFQMEPNEHCKKLMREHTLICLKIKVFSHKGEKVPDNLEQDFYDSTKKLHEALRESFQVKASKLHDIQWESNKFVTIEEAACILAPPG